MPIELSMEEIETAYKEGNITDKRLKFPADLRSLWGVVKALTIRIEKAEKETADKEVELAVIKKENQAFAEENARLLGLIHNFSNDDPTSEGRLKSLVIDLSEESRSLRTRCATYDNAVADLTVRVEEQRKKLVIAKNALRPIADLAPGFTFTWVSLKYALFGEPDSPAHTKGQMQRVFNRAVEAYKEL